MEIHLLRQIKQWQLNEALNMMLRALRCLITFFPVENPAVRPQVKEGEMWGTKRGFVGLRGSHCLHMLVILLQLNLILRERDRLFLHFLVEYCTDA